jgi:hypothetical protein
LSPQQKEWSSDPEPLNNVTRSQRRNRRIINVVRRNRAATSQAESWRNKEGSFTLGEHIDPGVTNLAAYWHETGHEVHISSFSIYFPSDCISQPFQYRLPRVSQLLRDGNGRRGHNPTLIPQWLEKSQRLFFISSAILAVTHPEQFCNGIEMLLRIKDRPELLSRQDGLEQMLHSWHVPFSGLAVVCNRKTDLHNDKKGHTHWYDVLVNMGSHAPIDFGLPGLASTFKYAPGTAISISGKLLGHEVPFTEGGDRVCFAFFMREKAREQFGIHTPNPSNTSSIFSNLPYLPL